MYKIPSSDIDPLNIHHLKPLVPSAINLFLFLIKMSLIAEAPDFLQVYSDGTVKRFAPQTAPPSLEPSNGFKSKDVIIDPSKPIAGRLFIPASFSSSEKKKLPLLVYFHGGGFCIGSTTWLGYHTFLGDFSATSQSVVLSVDYRLAPEHRLPTAYEDCYTSLEWLGDQVSKTMLYKYACEYHIPKYDNSMKYKIWVGIIN